MSAPAVPTTPAAAPHRAAGVRGPTLLRLTAVELRKLVDTRAGRWLLVGIGLISAAIVVVQLWVLADERQTFAEFFAPQLLPTGLLLPVLGILSITAEWSQRTALTTYALVPRRERVVAAKLAAVVLTALASVLVSLAVAALGTLVAEVTGGAGTWSFEASRLLNAVVLQVLNALMGAAFGLLLLNTPLAVVSYLVLPTVWAMLAGMVAALRGAAGWLDTSVTMEPLFGAEVTADQWRRLAVSVLVWVALPLAAGLLRTLRREVS